MIHIEPYYHGPMTKGFKLTFEESGFGTIQAEVPDLPSLHVAIDHYEGQRHNKAKCVVCKAKPAPDES